MITYTKQTTETKPRLVIKYDNDAETPRQYDNLGYFITQSDKHYSPDRNEDIQRIVKDTAENADNQEEHIKRITKAIDRN